MSASLLASRRARLLILPLVLLLCLGTFDMAYAADFRSGDFVQVPSGQTINDDLYVGAGTATIDGTVNGDLIIAGGSIQVGGTINGGVFVAGGSITINGQVQDSVRIAGGSAQINGRIGRDVIWSGGEVVLGSSSTVGGEVAAGGGNARLAGTVTRGVRGSYGALTIEGNVGEGVDVEVGQLTIASGASVGGPVTYRSSNDANIQPGAEVAGPVTRQPPTGAEAAPVLAGLAFVFWFLGFLMALLAGAIFVLALPRMAALVAGTLGRWPLPCLGWGALLVFVTPFIVVFLMIIIIGIPLALALLALYIAALWFAQVPVGLFIGTWIISRFRPVTGRGGLILALILGLVILAILMALPFVGGIVGFFVVLFGVGMLWLGLRRWIRGERPQPAA